MFNSPINILKYEWNSDLVHLQKMSTSFSKTRAALS